jgi:hypothetical protein
MRTGIKLSLISVLFLIDFTAFSQRVMQVAALEKPPVIDGQLDSLAWLPSGTTDNLFQLEPFRGEISSRRTDLYVGQYEESLYFTFVCYIDSRAEISARIQRRDQVNDSDDLVALVLDTYNDRRTALLFLVNPLGTLADAKITDDGKNIDFNWDTQWQAQVGIYKDFWIVEIKINLSDIQYSPNRTTWGFNYGRIIRINQETAWWSEVTEDFRISQGGTLNGIKPLKKNKSNLILFPYVTGRYENSDISEVYKKIKGDAGIDLRYNIGTNLSANLTYNPDFATVEGDQEIINLTPWELRFPDKRLFFQDGNELFATRINTFYSRRIGDMDWGGKIIGKAGKYQFNGLFSRTKDNEVTEEPAAFYNALRIKRDIFRSSVVGLTYADKITDSIYYRSLSLDYTLNLGKTWKLTGQFVGSGPGDFASHSAWFVRFARENNIYHYHLRYSNTGRNFQDNVNQTGFIPDDDRHEFDSDVTYKWWLNKKVSYLNFEGRNNVFWSQDGELRSWYLTYIGRMYLKSRWSLDLAYNNEYKNQYRSEMKDFFNHFYKVEVGFNTDEATFGSMGYTTGYNFDRNFNLLTGLARVRILNKMNISYEFNLLKYDPDPEENSTIINVLGVDYFFNKDLWFRVFTQNNSQINKYYFYGLFGWRFKPPFGAVYLIYSSDQYDAFLPDREFIQSKILFLKLTYPIRVF